MCVCINNKVLILLNCLQIFIVNSQLAMMVHPNFTFTAIYADGFYKKLLLDLPSIMV